MHQREYVIFIRPRSGGLTVHTMYFANEIRQVAEYGKTADVKLKPQEIKLAEQLVESLSTDFDARQYHDEYQQRLRALIEAKSKGRQVAVVAEPRRAPVIDIMQALKKSLAAAEASVPRCEIASARLRITAPARATQSQLTACGFCTPSRKSPPCGRLAIDLHPPFLRLGYRESPPYVQERPDSEERASRVLSIT
jgi:hypothetical protein